MSALLGAEPSRKLTPKVLPSNEAMVPRQLMFWATAGVAKWHKISAQKRVRRVFMVCIFQEFGSV